VGVGVKNVSFSFFCLVISPSPPFLFCKLLEVVLSDGRLDAFASVSLLGLKRLPSELKNDLTNLLQKLFVVAGATHCAEAVSRALGILLPKKGVQSVVGAQLSGAALSGDWKKFRSAVKTIWPKTGK
jgi:hypothetical protein